MYFSCVLNGVIMVVELVGVLLIGFWEGGCYGWNKWGSDFSGDFLWEYFWSNRGGSNDCRELG